MFISSSGRSPMKVENIMVGLECFKKVHNGHLYEGKPAFASCNTTLQHDNVPNNDL